jgi:hypothetical protein
VLFIVTLSISVAHQSPKLLYVKLQLVARPTQAVAHTEGYLFTGLVAAHRHISPP